MSLEPCEIIVSISQENISWNYEDFDLMAESIWRLYYSCLPPEVTLVLRGTTLPEQNDGCSAERVFCLVYFISKLEMEWQIIPQFPSTPPPWLIPNL